MEPGFSEARGTSGTEGATVPETPPPPRRSGLRWRTLRGLSDRMPLRTKLITAVLTLVILAVAAISFTSVYVLRSYLTTQYDSQLKFVYGNFASDPVAHFQGHSPGVSYPVRDMTDAYAGLQVSGSKLAAPSPPPGSGLEIPGGPPNHHESVPSIPTSTAWATANAGKLLTVGSQSGPDTWRVIVTPVSNVPLISSNGTTSETTGTLVVSWDLGNIDAEVSRLITIDLIVSAAIVLALTVIAIAAVRANLRPLDDIELTAGQIAAGHLDHRVPERDPRTEVGSLGRSLNAMLTQIEAAFHAREESEEAALRSEERMRRFIADASHELRTPLTTIRGFAEYYRQRGGARKIHPLAATEQPEASPTGMTPQELDRIMHRLESEASRMGLLVEDLLQLARLDQQRPLDMRPVDLLTLAADAVQDARTVAPDRSIDLTVAPGAAFLVNGDEPRLRQVIGNLVNNALTHTPAEASIQVSIASGTLPSGVPAVVLDVIDNGPGMTTEQVQRVFERFYRADAARNRASGGTGLGLAIVEGLVQAHGGQVSVKSAPGEGADFCVRLPLAPDALSPADEADDDLDLPPGDAGDAAPADEAAHRG